MTEEKRCVIFCAGPIEDDRFVLEQLQPNDIIICADQGVAHALRLGLAPDLVIGDFDSYHGPLEHLPVHQFPCDKDYTDTHLALEEGLGMGCREFVLFGALGGARLDHMLANIEEAFRLASDGIDISLLDSGNRIYCVVDRKIIIERMQSYHLSVISLSDRSCGVTLKGVKFPLNNVVLTNTFPLGVSNRITDEFASIEVKNGKLMVFLSKD
ncbi:thiamine diphosphokinase [Candidatus Soleaferrea massiliensis]|uniref:thiamine diphosphokinase n=1 Tax=Candidatus Soleaferrea massiliensis TaxID=1470354 RepID=UPI0018CFC8E7|nr:thiamine diphosphokinase [Candidatus Soleaferrea massiliensis]